MLLGLHPGVERVDLRIEKPGALEGRARAASVEVRRVRRDYPVSQSQVEHGSIELLLETREARLELVRLAPQRVAGAAPNYPAQSLEWVVAGEIELLPSSDQPLERGAAPARLESSLPEGVILSSSDAPSRLRNPGPEPASLFRCWKRTQ
jgi:hypothetical protein